MFANFAHIEEYIYKFNERFNIIALTETWLNAERGVDFDLEGYEFHHINRVNKTGGGVAIFIDSTFHSKVVEDMSFVIDNVLECISIEICNNKKKNTIISCVYRTPGSSLEVFNKWIEATFTLTFNKSILICGDFNIDLLKSNSHKSTNDFLQTMYCLNFHPSITKPTRISLESATLIDNIFPNEIHNNLTSGILFSDISDHLPIFTVYNVDHQNRKVNHDFLWRRIKSTDALDALKTDLLTHNWSDIYCSNDVNTAYSAFLNNFNYFYNKNCPMIQIKTTAKHRNEPWITNGI